MGLFAVLISTSVLFYLLALWSGVMSLDTRDHELYHGALILWLEFGRIDKAVFSCLIWNINLFSPLHVLNLVRYLVMSHVISAL